jgi:hypothetical protein
VEILRVDTATTPFNLGTQKFQFPVVVDGYASTAVTVNVTDLSDSTLVMDATQVTTTSASKITISVPLKYDADYKVQVYNTHAAVAAANLIFEDVYEVRRPYVDPNTKGTTATEIASYATDEQLARAIIDSIVDDGFYYIKKNIGAIGNGSDFIPVWDNVKTINAVYENNVLVTAKTFELTKDGSAITQTYTGELNRSESAPVLLPASSSDYTELIYGYTGFPREYDYRINADIGYVNVPSDIKRATELLIEDISCGRLDYYKRYIGSYNTDQFRIQFDKAVFQGTGNILVDKILEKYKKPVTRPGVL